MRWLHNSFAIIQLRIEENGLSLGDWMSFWNWAMTFINLMSPVSNQSKRILFRWTWKFYDSDWLILISINFLAFASFYWNQKYFQLNCSNKQLLTTNLFREQKFIMIHENCKILEPTTTIFGGPEMHVHEGSPLNISCVVHNSVGQPEFFFWKHNGNVSYYLWFFELDSSSFRFSLQVYYSSNHSKLSQLSNQETQAPIIGVQVKCIDSL